MQRYLQINRIFRDDLAKTTVNPGHISDISPKTFYHFATEFLILRSFFIRRGDNVRLLAVNPC